MALKLKKLSQSLTLTLSLRHYQNNDPTSHAVTQCIRNAGRRRDWRKLTLVTTLAPCPLSAGACVLLNFKRVVIGSSKPYSGRADWLKEAGIEVVDLDNLVCKRLVDRMMENRADLWQENMGK